MAELILIDKDKYKVNGILNEEDINKLNTFKNMTTIILDNTKGITSDLISKINNSRVMFSIKGGLDYDNKEKYNEQKYLDRTYISPNGLKKIVRYFEYNEKDLKPEWNEFEKAMYLYNALVVDMTYDENYETLLSNGTIERSLNGVLYSKLVCAGFAQVYKEMLDRIGIKNYYQNQKDVHAFNIIEINDKKYGLDVTWDNYTKKNYNGKCTFARFAHDKDFYNQYGHQLYKEELVGDDFETAIENKKYDKDEEVFELSQLSMEELNTYYKHIEEAIINRKAFSYNLQKEPDKTKIKYLPIDIINYYHKEEALKEYPMIIIMDFLKKRDALDINYEAFLSRKGYILDLVSDDDKYQFGNLNISNITNNNCVINKNGSIELKDGINYYYDNPNREVLKDRKIPQEKLEPIYKSLNNVLNNYMNKNTKNIIDNLDLLVNNYEKDTTNLDEDRLIENANIYSKLNVIENSKEYLIQNGMSEQQVNEIIEKIQTIKDQPTKTITSNKENDLDFLHGLFENTDLVHQAMQYDLNKELSNDEFLELYTNVDYVTTLFEKYITIGGQERFKLSNFDVTKDELKQILDQIVNELEEVKERK